MESGCNEVSIDPLTGQPSMTAAIRCSMDSFSGRVPSRVTCIMCVDHCLPAALAVSELMDELRLGPVPVVSDLRLPGWISEDSTVILLSCSSDQAQAMVAYERLKSRGAQVIPVLTRGELLAMCDRDGLGGSVLPDGPDEDSAVGHAIGTMVAIIDAGGADGVCDFVREQLSTISSEGMGSVADSVAESIRGKVVSTYAPSDDLAVAMRWRIVLGTASDELTFMGELPEFDHNELVGWSDPNVHAPELMMLVLKGARSDGLVQTIVDCMLEVLDENGRKVTVVDLGSGSAFARCIRGMMLADAVAKRVGGA